MGERVPHCHDAVILRGLEVVEPVNAPAVKNSSAGLAE